MPETPDPPKQVPSDPAPSDDHDAGLSGDLGTVTDEEWRQAHVRLQHDLAGVLPPDQLVYAWVPGLSVDSLPVDVLVALAVDPDDATVPGYGQYNPDAEDERFTGGGFRG